FYRAAFGLELKFEVHGMAFLGSPGAADVISLCAARKGAPVGNGGVSHFGFAMGDGFGQAIAQIAKAGGKPTGRGERARSMPFAFFTDTDGYVIEISK